MPRPPTFSLVCALAAAVAGGAGPASAAAEPFRVVATIFPLADIARRVGGNAASVITLLPPGASPHTYEPTPHQIRVCHGARLVFRVGAGADDWVDRVLAGGASEKAEVLAAADGAELLDDPAHTGRGDPHVWLDPRWIKEDFLPRLAAALARAAPERSAAVAAAAAEYAAELDRLDRDIEATAGQWTRKDFVALHQAWRYFARRYGLRQIGAIEESPGKEPSARAIARLVDAARASGVRAILVEPQLSRRVAAAIAAEFGGVPILVDPIGGEGIQDRDSYVALMRFNLRAFDDALR